MSEKLSPSFSDKSCDTGFFPETKPLHPPNAIMILKAIDFWGTSPARLYQDFKLDDTTRYTTKQMVDAVLSYLVKHELIEVTEKRVGHGPVFNWYRITKKGEEVMDKNLKLAEP